MNTLILNTKNEFYKLISKKKYLVILIIGAIVCAVRVGGTLLISKISHGMVNVKSNMVMEMLPLCTDILIPLITFMAVTDLFSSEVQEDNIKAVLLCPVSRFKVMTSKALAVLSLGAVYMAAYFIVCAVFQSLSGTKFPAAHTAAAYLIDIIPVIALIFMAVLINMISKSPSLAMLLCIGIYAVFKYMNYFVTPFGQLIFTAYSQWHKLWLGATLPLGAMISKVGILFGSILTLYTISYIIFDRKDF